MKFALAHDRQKQSRHRIVHARPSASVAADVVIEKKTAEDAMLGFWGGAFILAVVGYVVLSD